MARDAGLESMVNDRLAGIAGLTAKGMFGGWAWLLHGNMLCAARTGRLLFRVGEGNEAWALHVPGITRMVFAPGRQMPGWLHASPEAYGAPDVFERLMAESLEFVGAMPHKEASAQAKKAVTKKVPSKEAAKRAAK
jgi:hypothetical protein